MGLRLQLRRRLLAGHAETILKGSRASPRNPFLPLR